VRACACACMRVCVCACLCVCVYVCESESSLMSQKRSGFTCLTHSNMTRILEENTYMIDISTFFNFQGFLALLVHFCSYVCYVCVCFSLDLYVFWGSFALFSFTPHPTPTGIFRNCIDPYFWVVSKWHIWACRHSVLIPPCVAESETT